MVSWNTVEYKMVVRKYVTRCVVSFLGCCSWDGQLKISKLHLHVYNIMRNLGLPRSDGDCSRPSYCY